jgi:hypothetical protein
MNYKQRSRNYTALSTSYDLCTIKRRLRSMHCKRRNTSYIESVKRRSRSALDMTDM